MNTTETPVKRTNRVLVALAATAAVAPAMLAPTASAADPQILLVHGYGDAKARKDCNGSTWKNALAYYRRAGGRDRDSMTTIGYYAGDDSDPPHGADHGCDVKVASATNDTPIHDIAKEFANYSDAAYTGNAQPVNIIAHSMGGLITRVALLGSAQGWKGFPARKLNVANVVTLSTPHRGVSNPSANDDRQWKQMDPGWGFMSRLHEQGSGLGDDWAKGTDWSLVGSDEDEVVSYESGIDKNFAGTTADQGSKWLRATLTEASLAATRKKDTYLAARYQRLRGRRCHSKALTAVSHSILTAAWHMLTTGETYREAGADYYARQNPDRVTRSLIRRLEALGHHVTIEPREAAA